MFNYPVSKGIGWRISKDGGSTITVDNLDSLFSIVQNRTDEETAIEVESWAELATVGEVYEIRDLVIEVVDLEA